MSYGGDISAQDCWDLLQKDPSAILVDVRTLAEWVYVGLPAIEPERQQLLRVEWQVFPQMQVNPNFVEQLSQQLDELGAAKDRPLCFMCKGGVRSLAAAKAMTANGYENTLNILFGFEGQGDEFGHRGNINGWKADGLPWHQQ